MERSLLQNAVKGGDLTLEVTVSCCIGPIYLLMIMINPGPKKKCYFFEGNGEQSKAGGN